MSLRINPRIPVGIGIVLFFFFLFYLQGQILSFRGVPGRLLVKPGEFAVLVAMGGLRGVAADLLYLKTDELWQQGKWEQMLPLYRAITVLQPNYPEYWSAAGFHLAWDLSFSAKTNEERLKYLNQGIEFLKEGLSYNPDIYKLYFEIAFIYDQKFKDYDEAVKWYRKAVKFPGHPVFIDRLIAHSLKKKGDLEGAYQEWLRLRKVYPDDDYHQKIVERHLRIIEEEIKSVKKEK